jgi:hypothetical protein
MARPPRREALQGGRNLRWPAITLGALVAGILAAGGGRAASALLPRGSAAASVAYIAVALLLAGGAGVVLGTSDLLRSRWLSLRGRR